MSAAGLKAKLSQLGWCVSVPLGILIVYLGIGVGLVAVVGAPILGTAAVGAVVIAAVGAVRLVRPKWLTHRPSPQPKARTPRFGRAVVGCSVLAFLTGQSLALWLYTIGGSAGFDESVATRQEAGIAATLLLTLVMAPVSEEMLFRGLIYPLLRRRVGIIAAVLVTTATFALLHGNVVQFAAALPLAVLLALIYERTRVLWPCILLHLGFNLTATFVPPQLLTPLANPVSALLLTTAFFGYALVLYRQIAGRRPFTTAAARRGEETNETSTDDETKETETA